MSAPRPEEMASTLEMEPKKSRHSLRKWLYVLAAVVAINLLLIAYIQYASNKAKVDYKTKPVTVGALTVTVSATGNLEPTNTVNVGTELSGTITEVRVEENDPVRKGQTLALLDTAKLQSRVESSRSGVDAARAALNEADVALADAKNELGRAEKMRASSKGKLPSDQEYDALVTAVDRASARRENARAQHAQALSALKLETGDLQKSAILSPINGTVLVRNVEPGQTVAAALQTPMLFTIAEDLAAMELVVAIDEADIGSVKAGQRAAFTVDAYPDRRFGATIEKIKLNSRVVDGVVTYEGRLRVNNTGLLLRPGMTATAEITVQTLQEVLLVPNAALRYRPVDAEEEEEALEGDYLYVATPQGAKAIRVYPRGSDGIHTAVDSEELTPGTPVILSKSAPE